MKEYKTLAITLKPEQIEAVKAKCSRLEVPVSLYIRKLIKFDLEQDRACFKIQQGIGCIRE